MRRVSKGTAFQGILTLCIFNLFPRMSEGVICCTSQRTAYSVNTKPIKLTMAEKSTDTTAATKHTNADEA